MLFTHTNKDGALNRADNPDLFHPGRTGQGAEQPRQGQKGLAGHRKTEKLPAETKQDSR
jgi:hypothetical protein